MNVAEVIEAIVTADKETFDRVIFRLTSERIAQDMEADAKEWEYRMVLSEAFRDAILEAMDKFCQEHQLAEVKDKDLPTLFDAFDNVVDIILAHTRIAKLKGLRK